MKSLALIADKAQATYRNHEFIDALFKYLARYASDVEQRHHLARLSVAIDLHFARAMRPPRSRKRPAVGLVSIVLENPRSDDVGLPEQDFIQNVAAIWSEQVWRAVFSETFDGVCCEGRWG